MRKVLFKKIVEYKFSDPDGSQRIRFDWQKDFENEGLFHTWISDKKDGAIAIVELPDGTVEEVLPQNLKFVESPAMEPPVMEHTPVVDKEITKSISDGIFDALTRISMVELYNCQEQHLRRRICFEENKIKK